MERMIAAHELSSGKDTPLDAVVSKKEGERERSILWSNKTHRERQETISISSFCF